MIRDQLAENFGEELLFLDPPDTFDPCIVGVGFRHGNQPSVIYDTALCLQALAEKDGMDDLEALEYFDFNIAGAYVGEHTPIFLTRPEADG
jgi:hypothetical protein